MYNSCTRVSSSRRRGDASSLTCKSVLFCLVVKNVPAPEVISFGMDFDRRTNSMDLGMIWEGLGLTWDGLGIGSLAAQVKNLLAPCGYSPSQQDIGGQGGKAGEGGGNWRTVAAEHS